MGASKRCKALSGLTLAEVARRVGKPRKTLERWFVRYPRLFNLICLGAAEEARRLADDKTLRPTSIR